MTRLIRIGLLAAVVCLAAPALAGDCEDPSPEQMIEGQQKAMALIAAGPEHELLHQLEGEWEATVTMYMPGMDPLQSPMTSSNEMILGGRFLKSVSHGSVMGTPVESVSYFGYDRRREEYTIIGMDTMGTYHITAAGQYDEATRTLTLNGTDDDPALGAIQDYTFELTFNDDGGSSLSLTFNCPTFGTGAPFKMVEYTWTKAGAGK